MRLPSLTRWAVGLACGLALTCSGEAARGQAAKPEKVKFDTVDLVEIQGSFYPGPSQRKSPAVLMIHKIGKDSNQEGWDKLAAALQKAGCAVLTFDLRGHGDSKNVQPDFWKVPDNRSLVRGFNPNNPKDSIEHKDFNQAYYPALANDIAAAKLFLDKKNDAGDCNSANTILIGAEDGATLGLLWAYSECHRFRATNYNPLVPLATKLDSNPESKDLVACLWLSLDSSLGNRRTPTDIWVQYVGRDKKVPMAFLYGADDKKGEDYAKRCVNSYIKPDKTKQRFTVESGIKGTKLLGQGLLTANLETEKKITGYISEFLKENPPTDWERRDVDKTTYAWAYPPRGTLPILAKREGEKTLELIPLPKVGIR